MKVRVWRYLVADDRRAAAWARFQAENTTAYAEPGERLGSLSLEQQQLV